MITTTKTRLSRVARATLLSISAIVSLAALPAAGLLVTPGVAHAVVGRPLTPISYAGVARRTTRRAVATTAAVRTTAAMPVLPPGCVPSGAVYVCGATHYQQVIDGGNVVYVAVE